MSLDVRIAARHVWTPSGLRARAAVLVDEENRIRAVVDAIDDEPLLEGILVPGLVNAHGRLAHSHHREPVGRAGLGGPAWMDAVEARQGEADAFTAERGARAARAKGTAFWIDVDPSGGSVAAMAMARLRGAVQVECVGMTEAVWRPGLVAARQIASVAGVEVRTTAGAPPLCAPDLLVCALAPGSTPATICCDRDAADAAFLMHRSGAWVDFHRRREADRTGLEGDRRMPMAASGVALLDELGLLGPHLGLVHLTAADDATLDRVARAGSTVVLCPRSSLHITGRLPDVPGMVARGIPLAMGTDSRASTSNLDVLEEAAVLRAAFPEISSRVWMQALTTNGGRLSGQGVDAGRIEPGARPDLLLVEIPEDSEPLARLFDGTPWPRRWLT